MSIQEKAKKAARYFETAERATVRDGYSAGEIYVRIRADAPEWVHEIVKAAHGRDVRGAPEYLPDDYRYRWTKEALDYIAESPEDADWEHFDGEDRAEDFAESTDTYTSDLLAWLGSHSARLSYADDFRADYAMGGAGSSTIEDMIRGGQYLERREVFQLVLEALRASE